MTPLFRGALHAVGSNRAVIYPCPHIQSRQVLRERDADEKLRRQQAEMEQVEHEKLVRQRTRQEVMAVRACVRAYHFEFGCGAYHGAGSVGGSCCH